MQDEDLTMLDEEIPNDGSVPGSSVELGESSKLAETIGASGTGKSLGCNSFNNRYPKLPNPKPHPLKPTGMPSRDPTPNKNPIIYIL